MTRNSEFGIICAIFLISLIVPQAGHAQPAFKDVCDTIDGDKYVAPPKLLKYLMADTKATFSNTFIRRTKSDADFFDTNFCAGPASCDKADRAAMINIGIAFSLFKGSAERNGYHLKDASVDPEAYFGAKNQERSIQCIGSGPQTVAAAQPTNSPIHLRSSSDDIWIDRFRFPAEFKGTTPATINFSGDHSSGTPTSSISVLGAIGYDFDLSAGPMGPYRDLIPYFEANESETDTRLKPRNIAALNYVATGAMFTDDIGGNNYFSVKPSYLWGTTMGSELAAVRLIYAPWTNANNSPLPLPFNTSIPLTNLNPSLPALWAQLLFDVRSDSGVYTNRGLPAFANQNINFERIGTKTGFAFWTPQSVFPPITFRMTETEMYGTGIVRNINEFNTSLSVGLDPQSLTSFTLMFTSGYDENTAAKNETYKVGFSGKY